MILVRARSPFIPQKSSKDQPASSESIVLLKEGSASESDSDSDSENEDGDAVSLDTCSNVSEPVHGSEF